MKKVCFIIWGEDEFKCSECLDYILEQNMPENIEIDALTVLQSENICNDLDECIDISDAEIMIYINENVLLINKNTIENLVEIMNDDIIGMVGLIGYRKTDSEDGFIRIGNIYTENIEDKLSNIKKGDDNINGVDMVDPSFMVLRSDIKWSNNDGNSFVDISIEKERQLSAEGKRLVVLGGEETYGIWGIGAFNYDE